MVRYDSPNLKHPQPILSPSHRCLLHIVAHSITSLPTPVPDWLNRVMAPLNDFWLLSDAAASRVTISGFSLLPSLSPEPLRAATELHLALCSRDKKSQEFHECLE